MSYKFFGGVHVHHGEDPSVNRPSQRLAAPPQVVIPMSLHIGKPCTPCVAVGDQVKLGQLIGEASGPVCAPIHSSVSGTVVAIEPRLTSMGAMTQSVIIDNDGLDTPDESMVPYGAEALNDPDAIVQAIRDGGIVGMGGATFPTAFKISSGLGKVDTVIINGCECEPFLFSDHRVMMEHPDEVIEGIRLVVTACRVPKATLVIEDDKPDAIALLTEKARGKDFVEVLGVRTRYPQGAEKQLVYAVTGREVPPGGLPAAVGCSVFNLETCYAIYEKLHLGKPLIERMCTVLGTSFAESKCFQIRIGTPVSYLVEQAGGFVKDPVKMVMGGPMMGMPLYDLSVPTNKGTNGLLAFAEDTTKASERSECIRCGRCVEACPMRLLPTYLYMYERKGDLDMAEKYNIMDCLECGACTYNCPARLPLTHSCKTGKAKIQARNAERKAKAEAEAAKKEKEAGK